MREGDKERKRDRERDPEGDEAGFNPIELRYIYTYRHAKYIVFPIH